MLHLHRFRNWFMRPDKLPAPRPRLSPRTQPHWGHALVGLKVPFHQGRRWAELWSSSRNPPRSVSKQTERKPQKLEIKGLFGFRFLLALTLGISRFLPLGLTSSRSFLPQPHCRGTHLIEAKHNGQEEASRAPATRRGSRGTETPGSWGLVCSVFPNLQESIHLRLLILLL